MNNYEIHHPSTTNQISSSPSVSPNSSNLQILIHQSSNSSNPPPQLITAQLSGKKNQISPTWFDEQIERKKLRKGRKEKPKKKIRNSSALQAALNPSPAHSLPHQPRFNLPLQPSSATTRPSLAVPQRRAP
jgi:hypothetical protein